jgi:hypothetical protein
MEGHDSCDGHALSHLACVRPCSRLLTAREEEEIFSGSLSLVTARRRRRRRMFSILNIRISRRCGGGGGGAGGGDLHYMLNIRILLSLLEFSFELNAFKFILV